MNDREDDLIQAVTSHVIGVFNCPRGEHVHINLRFDPWPNPPDKLFRHWGWCEETRSPILLYWDGTIARIK